MGWFKSSDECDENGGHDQRPHKRDEPDGTRSTVVTCVGCNKEWKYDEKGKRR